MFNEKIEKRPTLLVRYWLIDQFQIKYLLQKEIYKSNWMIVSCTLTRCKSFINLSLKNNIYKSPEVN